ncbi:MAG TPA: hypothetical protein VE871_19315 [Longimicrobium sp.]|nr:hypothetical protein [Longimicrobium sp.]
MAKETLRIELDSGLVDRVRRYSEEHGTGVAETIEQLIGTLPAGPNGRLHVQGLEATSGLAETEDWILGLTPSVRKLLGAGAGDADEEDCHRHLLEKYGR